MLLKQHRFLKDDTYKITEELNTMGLFVLIWRYRPDLKHKDNTVTTFNSLNFKNIFFKFFDAAVAELNLRGALLHLYTLLLCIPCVS